MTAYLLDTNVCIDFALGRSRSLLARMEAHVGTMAMSAITLAELHVGARTSTDPEADRQALSQLARLAPVRPFDEAAAAAYGRLARAGSFRRGGFDRLIAAHAVALDHILITANLRDIAGISGLVAEDWTR